MSTVPSAPCQPPARSSVSWARVHCATSPMSAPHRVHCALSPLPAPCQVLCFLGSCPMCPPAPCQPPPRFSVAWARVHCAPSPLSPCQVFCLLGSCPLRLQPPVRPLPGLLSPGLMSATLSDPCFPDLGMLPGFPDFSKTSRKGSLKVPRFSRLAQGYSQGSFFPGPP